MKLSIITINYNNCNGLYKTIQSVISQTWKEFEWILIDGGSTDGSKELIAETANQCSQIFYWCSEPDKGIYNAMNKGITKSSGDYLLFLNSGDYLLENTTLEECKKKLHINSDFYVGRVIDDKDNISTDYTKTTFTALNVYQGPFPHQGCFIKRDVFMKYGLYDETYKITADWKLYVQALVVGTATVSFTDDIISRIESGGVSSDPIKLHNEGVRIRQELLSKYLINDLKKCISINDLMDTRHGKLFFAIAYRLSMLFPHQKNKK